MCIQQLRNIHGLLLSVMLLTTACGAAGVEVTPVQPVATVAPTPIPPATAIVVQPVATASVVAPSTEPAGEIDFAPLVAVIEQEMAAQQVPGLALAVIHKGQAIFSQGFGVADVASNRAVTPATPFRIASLTKPLTAIGLLKLVEAGQVDLDAAVVSYLPEFRVNDQITVRQLLSHSSGLGDAAIPYGRTDAAALQDYVASLTPESAFAPPGTVFSYSNPGFNTVGRIIEVVTGMAYSDYMMSQVFPALGMAHTTFAREDALAEGLALGYYPSRDAPTPVDRDPDNGAEYPSGFAFSTVEDLTRLALFLLNDGLLEGEQFLQPAAVQAMQKPVLRVEPLEMGYGLGLVVRARAGETTVGHNGNINGYAATLEVMPSQELALVVLSNRNNYDPARITQAIFDLVVGPVETPLLQEIMLDEATLNSYVGRYATSSAFPAEEAEVGTVTVQGGHLSVSLPGVTFELRAVGSDLFDLYVPQVPMPINQLAFLRDQTGAIQYISLGMRALRRLEE